MVPHLQNSVIEFNQSSTDSELDRGVTNDVSSGCIVSSHGKLSLCLISTVAAQPRPKMKSGSMNDLHKAKLTLLKYLSIEPLSK